MKKKVLIVVGTRPNFIKITRFKEVSEHYPEIEIKVVHTGQHFDAKMADVFFNQFKLQPDFNLHIGEGTPNTQMSLVMQGLEKVIKEYLPDLMMVVGDVNSTFAAALTANKTGIPLAHLESGLRSFDRSMPEEINRILTDEITDLFFVTEKSGIENLKKEGKSENSIHFVGNTMIDSMVVFRNEIMKSNVLNQLKLEPSTYVLMTMHRPSNVDTESGLKTLIRIISYICRHLKVVFPIHPRTIQKMKSYGLMPEFDAMENLIFTEAIDYFSFQKLISHSACVVTDSGGIQEETTYRQIPCITLRNNTERPSTIEFGTNQLVDYDAAVFAKVFDELLKGNGKKGTVPPLWDGHTTERIMKAIQEWFAEKDIK